MLEFQEPNKDRLRLIEDFKIIEDRIVLNFENEYMYIFGVNDLLH